FEHAVGYRVIIGGVGRGDTRQRQETAAHGGGDHTRPYQGLQTRSHHAHLLVGSLIGMVVRAGSPFSVDVSLPKSHLHAWWQKKLRSGRWKTLADVFHFQHITHWGACGKAPVMTQNHWQTQKLRQLGACVNSTTI